MFAKLLDAKLLLHGQVDSTCSCKLLLFFFFRLMVDTFFWLTMSSWHSSQVHKHMHIYFDKQSFSPGQVACMHSTAGPQVRSFCNGSDAHTNTIFFFGSFLPSFFFFFFFYQCSASNLLQRPILIIVQKCLHFYTANTQPLDFTC